MAAILSRPQCVNDKLRFSVMRHHEITGIAFSMCACMHAWLHLVCAHECRCIYISFASVWIHVPLQELYLPLMYLCAVYFNTFCLLCPVSYLEHACCYFVFPCNRCNKEHFELELEFELELLHNNKHWIIRVNLSSISLYKRTASANGRKR